MPFSNYRDNFDAETLAILQIAFNEAWEVLLASGGDFDQKATRHALAELIMSFAAEGETDPPEPQSRDSVLVLLRTTTKPTVFEAS